MPERLKAFLLRIPKPVYGITYGVLALLGMPLNMIVWMRWVEWDWGPALIATLLIGMIPLFGQLATTLLAVVGAYYFVDAGWDWHKATQPAPRTASISPMTSAQLESFKAPGPLFLVRGWSG